MASRRIQTTLEDDGRMHTLVKHVVAAFKALSAEEQSAQRREQTISWVYGEMRLAGENVTKEGVAAIVDSAREGRS